MANVTSTGWRTAAAVMAVTLWWPALAGAQTAGDGSTPTVPCDPTTTTTTTAPCEPVTTTTPPPPDTVPPPPPPPVDQPPAVEPPPVPDQPLPGGPPPPPPPAADDALAEAPPPEPVVIPPAARPPSVDARRVTTIVTQQMLAARAEATAAETARLGAVELVSQLEARTTRLEAALAELHVDERRAVRSLRNAKKTLDERAADAYIRGPLSNVSTLIEAKDPNEFLHRLQLVSSVLDADEQAIVAYRKAKERLSEELTRLAADLDSTRRSLEMARADAATHTAAAEESMQRVTAYEAGSAVAVGGFVFPVGDPHNFVDTFGAPRMPGTVYEHFHQGTDIFAPSGTPLYAVEHGVVVKMGSDVLGGIKLWLVGATGHRYYYAHLSAFAEGLVEGQVVQAGDVLGFVGNTGNAATTPAHLHFQVHPNGGPAANPYPILKVIDDASKAARRATGP